MTAVVVVASVFPVRGREAEARAALLRAVARVHGEDGCELYALHQKDDRFVLIEKWTSQEALNVHASAAALTDLRAELVGVTSTDLDIQVLTAVPAGTPEQGGL